MALEILKLKYYVALEQSCLFVFICRARSWSGAGTGSYFSTGNSHSGHNRFLRAAKKTIQVSLIKTINKYI